MVKSVPGKYDQVIHRYYNSDQARKRLLFEQKGIDDIKK